MYVLCKFMTIRRKNTAFLLHSKIKKHFYDRNRNYMNKTIISFLFFKKFTTIYRT